MKILKQIQKKKQDEYKQSEEKEFKNFKNLGMIKEQYQEGGQLKDQEKKKKILLCLLVK